MQPVQLASWHGVCLAHFIRCFLFSLDNSDWRKSGLMVFGAGWVNPGIVALKTKENLHGSEIVNVMCE